MTIRSGLGSQIGFAAESVYGTYVAPTRFLEFNSEGLIFNRETIQSAGIRKGSTVQRTGRWAVNKKGGGGPVTFEMATKGFGLILKHAMGNVAITTPGTPAGALARIHTHTLGDLDDLSLTIQKGLPDVETGTVRAFSFLGCTVTEWTLSVDVDGLLMFNPTFDAQDMSTAQSLATASFATADKLFSYQQVAVTISAGGEEPTAVSINAGHGMNTARYFIRSNALKKRPVIAARRTLGGTMTFEFEDMVQVNRFLNAAPGAEVALEITATGDEIDVGFPANSNQVKVTVPAARFDGEVPVVGGPDILTVTAPFEILDNGSAQPLTVIYQTSDTAS